jgi:hypothetical protein
VDTMHSLRRSRMLQAFIFALFAFSRNLSIADSFTIFSAL